MANSGDLDATFAGNGKKSISFRGTDSARAVLVQPNGRIVVAGGGAPGSSFCVARLRSDGKLDTTFGVRGKKTITFGRDNESAFGAALQEDGKILLAGDADFRVAIARLKPNGSLDATFSEDGKKLFTWGKGGLSRATAVIPLPNGKIVLAGFSGPETGNVQAARLTAGGVLDKTFGVGGIATIDFDGDDFGLAAARQANGRIVIAGESRPTLQSGPSKAIVTRLRTNGALDLDFNGNGRLEISGMAIANAVVIQPDRKIVVAGNPPDNSVMMVVRLNPNGSLDATLGGDGIATIDFGGDDDFANAMALQADGKIVVAGYIAGGIVAVARLNSDGSPDGTFSTDGRATIDFGDPTFGNTVAVQKNKRIVIAGDLTAGDNFAIARLLG
jgi:uncharacterized delta-60 repeat protein